MNPEDKTCYTTLFQEAFLKYVEIKYCNKHRHVPIMKPKSIPNNNLFPSANASGSSQSSFIPYDLSNDDKEFLTPNKLAETIPRRSDRPVRLLTTTRLHSISPPAGPMNGRQINPNLNDNHSNQMQISSTFRIPDITNWWRQQVWMHSQYADLSIVACDIFSITPYAVRVEAIFSFEWDAISWRQSTTTGKTLCKKVIVRQFAQSHNGILAGDDLALDTMNTENHSQMKKEAEERKLNRMTKVYNFLEIW